MVKLSCMHMYIKEDDTNACKGWYCSVEKDFNS